MISRFNHQRSTMLRTAILLLLLLLLSQQGVWGAIKQSDPRLERINGLKAAYGLALKAPAVDNGARAGSSSVTRPASLGSVAAGPNSRGALVAQTWRDFQSCANMNRTVAVTPAGNTFGTGVQFSYTYKASSVGSDWSKWGWEGYDAIVGSFVRLGGIAVVQSTAPNTGESGSYPKILIYPRNGKGIMGSYDLADMHNAPYTYQMHISFETVAFSGAFGNMAGGSIMADSLNRFGNLVTSKNYNTIWPALGMTVTATDTVLYLFGFEAITTEPYGAAKVFRHLSTARGNPDNLWDLVFADTSFKPTLDFSASRVSSRVAAVWINQTPAGRISGNQQDNDVFYATSPTGLSGTWTKYNLTNYTGAGYRAWVECNSLFDSADRLHIIWNAAVTDGVTFMADRSCRLFHWSEFNPGTFSTIYSALFSAYDLPCVGGDNVMNVGSFSIGECDGRLYTVFSSWNDPQLEPANDSDCAKNSDWLYGANGELYVTISKDLTGTSWDKPHNLSNSFARDCDTSGNCADDRFASISERWIDNNTQPGTWPPAATYDPHGSGTGNVFTQIFYQTDRYPGASLLGIGPYTLNDMRWIRLACSLPVLEATLAVTPNLITFPAYVRPAKEKDTSILLENIGNANLTFSSIDVEEDSCTGPGCVSGWLGYTGIDGTSSLSEGSSATMTLQLNKGGVVVDSSRPHTLWGRVVFNYGPPVQAETLNVHITIGPPVAGTALDTITTATSIKLVCGSNGNAGNDFAGKVNMNFNPAVECDTGFNMRGNAGIYLGDASPVIVRKVGTDTARASWSIFSQGYSNANGFKPLPPGDSTKPYYGRAPKHTIKPQWQEFFSGTFATVDSLLKVEKTWYAPTNSVDSANFVVEKLQIWPSHPGTAVTNLAIGAAYDWDVPSDSGSANAGGYDAARSLVYQKGFNSLDTITDCANNGLRYAGSALVSMTNDNLIDSCKYISAGLYGGYTMRNDSFVYPRAGFVPAQLWTNMQRAGYYNQDGPSTYTDLHTVLTFRNVNSSTNGGWTLPAQAHDTLTIYTVMGVVRTATTPAAGLDSLKSVIDKGKRWANYWIRDCRPCCIGKRGNVNMVGVVDLADLSAMIACLTSEFGCTFDCYDEANVNGVGIVDLADVSALVSYLTGGGFQLVNCP